MSAYDIVASVVPELESGRPDFVCLNFANPDMVGHTGVFDAVIKAVETTDTCLRQVIEAGQGKGYHFVIIADHGNADYARNPDGTPHTAHTTNPVPIIILSDQVETLRDGILADVAPTILKLMNVEQPVEMTGLPLF
jgi:2,3-bisphosphoglycerate-independent phosphoglycerate mutase